MENSFYNSALGNKSKIVLAVAALTVASYLVLTKYHGKEYLIERLKRRDEAIRLDQRCAQIRKKVESMAKSSPSIVHPNNELFILKQFGIDFVITQRKQGDSKDHIRTVSGTQIAPDLVEETTPRVT